MMACHLTPSATNRIITLSTPANTTLHGALSIAEASWSTAWIPVLKRLFRAFVSNCEPTCSNSKLCQTMSISWSKLILNTASIGWYAPSKGVPLGSYARNIPGSSHAYPACGRTRTLSPPLVVPLWKSSSSTSKTRSWCSMIQRQLKLRLNPGQEAQLNTWLFHLTGVWNWAIRKIEQDAQDGIYYTPKDFQNLLADHGKKLGIPNHTLQGMLVMAYTAW